MRRFDARCRTVNDSTASVCPDGELALLLVLRTWGGCRVISQNGKERAVLGTLIAEWPDPLPAPIRLLLRNAPDSFDDQRLGIVAVAIHKTAEDGHAVNIVSVERRLNGELESIGGTEFLRPLLQESLPPEMAEEDASTLWSAYRDRRRLTVLDDASAALRANPEAAHSICRNVLKSLEELAEGDSNDIEARRFDPARKPEALRAVYSLADVPICTPGNITAITAEAKAGKSALLGAMIAATMKTIPEENSFSLTDTLSVSSDNPHGLALVHVDTEQSPDDHWRLVTRALNRARVEAPGWLRSYCLTGMGATQTFAALKAILKRSAVDCGGVHSCLIDGVADLVQDVNDSAKTNPFVAELHDLAIRYDCPIVGVVHFNPGSEKSRGHLGSQLERKAESNLKLKKDGEVTVVFSTKQRRAPILEATGPRFRWCQEAGMHVSCANVASERDEQRRETFLCKRDDVFGNRQAMRYSELLEAIKTTRTCSLRTAEREFEEYRRLGLIEKSVANLWTKTP
jgi:hypothetical protein